MEHKMHKASRQLPEDETLELLKEGTTESCLSRATTDTPTPPPSTTSLSMTRSIFTPLPTAIKSSAWSAIPSAVFPPLSAPGSSPKKSPLRMRASFSPGRPVFVEDRAEKQAALEAFVTQKHPGYEEIGFQMIAKQIDKTAVLRLDPVALTGKAYRG